MEQDGSSTQEAGDLLCLILDLNPRSWVESGRAVSSSLSLTKAIEQIMIFCNAHLALRHENELCIIVAVPGAANLVFSSRVTGLHGDKTGHTLSTAYQQFRIVDEAISGAVVDSVSSLSDEQAEEPVAMVGALSKALCHINRINASDAIGKPRSRIAIMSVSEDDSGQYIGAMNCIFSAQKIGIPIDVCKIHGPNAVFLQQACNLTSGTYYKIEEPSGLLQYLMMSFLPGAAARRHLNRPSQDEVDLRAACFCHRNIIDIGFVCSVCLSIFCAPVPVCSTCKTKFPLSTLRALGGMGAGGSGAGKGARSRPAPSSTTANGDGPAKKKRRVPATASSSAAASPAPSTPASTD